MRKGIATVSVSGLFTEKLDAIAAAGFDGVEIFDNDLIACPSSPREIAKRCAALGLTVDLFQPMRNVEGVPPERFDAVLHRARRRFEVAVELGAETVLACSNTGSDAVADPDLTAEQLHRVGTLAAEHGVTVAFEALAWGRHIDRVGQSWQAVVAADHPNVTLAVDTFHMLARGDGPDALGGVAGERIGFLQVADAPLLDMNVLEWSRHFRCFPGQGTLDVAGVVLAVLKAGYDGPLSLEVFSDLVREEPPAATARDGMRSLVFLEDQVARRLSDEAAPAADVVTVAPPAPGSVCTGFLELPGSAEVTALLHGLGFAPYRAHRSKPVTWWRRPWRVSPPARKRCSGRRWLAPAAPARRCFRGSRRPADCTCSSALRPATRTTGSATSREPTGPPTRAGSYGSTTWASPCRPSTSTRRSASSARCSV